MTTWLPLHDKMIVRRENPDEKLSKEADIVVAEKYKGRKSCGVVVVAGDGRITPSGAVVPLKVEVGMQVLWGQHSGIDFKDDDGIDYVVLREDELLAYRRPAPARAEAA